MYTDVYIVHARAIEVSGYGPTGVKKARPLGLDVNSAACQCSIENVCAEG